MELKEKLLHYMLGGHVHLSKKDYGFFHNLQHLIKDTKRITTNQCKLFDKLLVKYQRQLKKNGLDYTNLLDLPWNVQVVESKQEFLDARIYLERDEICIKAPFNNNFIASLRNRELNCFAWDKSNKLYRASQSTYNLKMALELVTKHYTSAKISTELEGIIDNLTQYKDSYWAPTLVRKNNNYYIAGISEPLYDKLANTELNDDPKTLHYLTLLGIKVDLDIVKDNEFLRFASEYNTDVSIEQLDDLVNWIKGIGVDYVWFTRDLVYNKVVGKMISQRFDQSEIKYGSLENPNAKNPVRLTLSNNLLRSNHNGVFYKTIMIRNSLAIDIQ